MIRVSVRGSQELHYSTNVNFPKLSKNYLSASLFFSVVRRLRFLVPAVPTILSFFRPAFDTHKPQVHASFFVLHSKINTGFMSSSRINLIKGDDLDSNVSP
jgi:hypothetical protein